MSVKYSEDDMLNTENRKRKDEKYDLNEGPKQDLVHIIKTLDSATKQKKITIEEIFEILKEPKLKSKNYRERPTKKKQNFSKPEETKQYRLNQQFKSSHSQSTKENKKNTRPDLSKLHFVIQKPNNTETVRENNRGNERPSVTVFSSKQRLDTSYSSKQLGNIDSSRKLKYPTNQVRQKSLNMKSTTELKSGNVVRKTNRSTVSLQNSQLSKYNSSRKIQYEFLSPVLNESGGILFDKTHRRENTEINEKKKRVKDKYQTKPPAKVQNVETTFPGGPIDKKNSLKEKGSKSSFEQDISHFFDDNSPLNESETLLQKPLSLFERLKGDERDLPGVYTRFVRRSKGASSRNSELLSSDTRKIKKKNSTMEHRKMMSSENREGKSDSENGELILGELIFDKPVNEKLLEMINKKPFKYNSDLFRKAYENKVAAKTTTSENPRNTILTLENKKEQKTKNNNELSELNHNIDTNIRDDNELEQLQHETISDNEMKIYEALSKLPKKTHGKKKRNFTKKGDLVNENLNMSPTTAITMMVLAADKVLAKKSDVFENSLN